VCEAGMLNLWPFKHQLSHCALNMAGRSDTYSNVNLTASSFTVSVSQPFSHTPAS